MKLTVEDVILEFKRPVLVDENGCWNWMGSISTQGYAIFNNKPVYGILYTKSGRVCPPDKVLRHTCANKRCVRPDHIIEGTYSENLIDSILDGSRGLGRDTYATIIELAASGMRRSEIAKRLNISRSAVSYFFKGKLLCFKPEQFGGKTDAIVSEPSE